MNGLLLLESSIVWISPADTRENSQHNGNGPQDVAGRRELAPARAHVEHEHMHFTELRLGCKQAQTSLSDRTSCLS